MQFTHKLTNTGIYAQFLYRIHPEDAKKLDEAGLFEVTKKSVYKINKLLNHKECNILFFADTFGVIPEQGIGGRCGQSDIVNIFIDPNHKAGLKQNIEKWLFSALAHELYHARRYMTHKFGVTLGESLIEEGLPTMFEEFMQPNLEVPYAHHLSKKELHSAWEKAKPLLNSKEYSRDDWFYGGSGIQKWTGYSLGYEMVRQYLEKNPKENPATLVDIDPRDVVRNFNID